MKWPLINSSQNLEQVQSSLISREFFNLIQISLGAILLYRLQQLELVLLVSLQLLQVLLNERKLKRKVRLERKEKQLKEKLLEEEKKELKQKLKELDYETLKRLGLLVAKAQEKEKLLEAADSVVEKLNTVDEELKENIKSLVSEPNQEN